MLLVLPMFPKVPVVVSVHAIVGFPAVANLLSVASDPVVAVALLLL